MASSQVGKTELILNIAGFFIDHDPGPILSINPTVEMAETFSKDRFSPMVRDTPALQGKIKDRRSRDSENTIRHKQFPGGHITFAGANSPASLASRPIRYLLGDELDRFPPAAGKEGDPWRLAEKRSTSFWNRLSIAVSSPTLKGFSRIERLYEESDRRLFHVPCADCGVAHPLMWRNVHWENSDPSTAVYACEECGSVWDDVTRWGAIRKGTWIARNESRGIAGFHLNELLSPFVRLDDMVDRWLAAQGDPEALQVFVNTALAETWEEKGEGLEPDPFLERLEEYGPEDLPEDVVIVTAGVDVQDDRLEVEIVGWSSIRESWSIDYRVIEGDPSTKEPWDYLDDLLFETTFRRVDGAQLRINATGIDTGGSHTQRVYDYVRPRQKKRVFGLKGMAGARPIWPEKVSRNNRGKIALRIVGVDSAKDLIYSYLRQKSGGTPGFCHFPADRDPQYFAGLTCERKVTKWSKGRPVSSWVKSKDARNEPLDCRVYALAALLGLNPNFTRVNARLIRTIEDSPADMPAPPSEETVSERVDPRKRPPRVRRKGSWAKNF